MKPFYFTLGWTFFGIGFAGAFLPVLPTTPFMLVSLWCFSRSSPRFHDWLYSHKFFGPPLQQWSEHRVIPRSAKIVAVFFMTTGLIYIYYFADLPLWVTLLASAIILYGCWFILTKPSTVPETPAQSTESKNQPDT